MPDHRFLIASIALLFLPVGCASSAANRYPPPSVGSPPPGAIQVTGQGRVTAAPDSARVSIGVEAFAKSLAEASEQANGDMQRVISVLRGAGVPPEDVRTTNYDVMVERRNTERGPEPEPIGFRVSTSAEVRVRDLSRLGAILDRVVSAGSNQIHGLQLERADPTSAQARALAAAYEDARAKATELARAAKVKLGKIVSVAESSGFGGPIPLRAEAIRAGAPVATGELEFTAQVTATFEIE
ncbi:MAG TPA: SIMPL domain-containing protein [Myxococcaceae bacterium]|nr:SIMPL domain-containing protein [Myxococcaceae bacterium]